MSQRCYNSVSTLAITNFCKTLIRMHFIFSIQIKDVKNVMTLIISLFQNKFPFGIVTSYFKISTFWCTSAIYFEQWHMASEISSYCPYKVSTSGHHIRITQQ